MLAKSWTISDDGRTYTFELNKANWQDGKPLTSRELRDRLDRELQRNVAMRVRPGGLLLLDRKLAARAVNIGAARVANGGGDAV